ncbi:hypothetical protein B0I35DRAFT_20667 [Stachybotrys elegans]|uniref:Uncharacterized protein n=1 Tax=Stachybotrys elegans TaxID=80388 RepID=A0A8K0T1J8_9HYPO|nr:hypothetical protein B0I35DRAFT_20667 [Stachybotrys elegans]
MLLGTRPLQLDGPLQYPSTLSFCPGPSKEKKPYRSLFSLSLLLSSYSFFQPHPARITIFAAAERSQRGVTAFSSIVELRCASVIPLLFSLSGWDRVCRVRVSRLISSPRPPGFGKSMHHASIFSVDLLLVLFYASHVCLPDFCVFPLLFFRFMLLLQRNVLPVLPFASLPPLLCLSSDRLVRPKPACCASSRPLAHVLRGAHLCLGPHQQHHHHPLPHYHRPVICVCASFLEPVLESVQSTASPLALFAGRASLPCP